MLTIFTESGGYNTNNFCYKKAKKDFLQKSKENAIFVFKIDDLTSGVALIAL